jgi:hypothetical protein
VLAADLGRLEGEREEAFFSVGSPLDFDQPTYPGTTVVEPRRSMRKLIVGVAVLLVLSLVGLLLTINALSGPKQGSANAAPTGGGAGATTGGTQGGGPAPLPISANQVRVVDPDGDRKELAGVAKAFDGDPNTAWVSSHYRESGPNFGYKQGMGILIDLGSPKQVASVQVTMTPGATIELRSGASDPGPDSGRPGDLQIVQTFTPGPPKTSTSGSGGTVLNGPTDPVRYLMVWISKLPPTPDSTGQYQVQVREIQVKVN